MNNPPKLMFLLRLMQPHKKIFLDEDCLTSPITKFLEAHATFIFRWFSFFSMFILLYLISNAWSAISAISNCKLTLFPQSNKNPYHAKNTLLYNFYTIHYVSILFCQVIPLARLLLLLYAKKSKFIFFVINRGSRGTTLFSPGVFIHVKTHNYLKG